MCGTTPDSTCDMSCMRKFGLPITMNGITPLTDPQVPCALKSYIQTNASRKVLKSLSDQGNQVHFLHWVKRRANNPAIEEDELKMCPLIWCRKTFGTIELAIRHVVNCPLLLNAWYWCPFDRRPERFLECNRGCEIIPRPKMHHAARFFNWFGRRRSLKRQAKAEPENTRPIEADQRRSRVSRPELGISNEHQRFEVPGSEPPLRTGRQLARMAVRVDDKAGHPSHQSQIAEVYNGEVPELAANPKSVVWPPHGGKEPSVLLNKPLPSVPLQRRSSPGLINSERESDNLWSRRRRTPASHPHSTNVDPYRSDCSVVGLTEKTTLSSRRDSKLRGSLHSVPTRGDKKSNSSTYTLQDDPTASYQTRDRPLSHEVSPEDPIPSTSHALTNAAFPSSSKTALASLPSDMLSPISPMIDFVHPPLTSTSANTLSHDFSSSGTSEHQEENAGCLTSHLSLPFFDSMETRTPISPQADSIMSQVPLPTVQKQHLSEELGVEAVSTQPHHQRMYSANPEGFIRSNGSRKVSEAETPSSMTQSVVTQVYNPRSENSGLSPIAFSPKFPRQNGRTQPDSPFTINIQSTPDPTRPSATFHNSPRSRSLNRQLGILAEPVMEMGDFDFSDTNHQDLEQSDAGSSLWFSALQPWSPLDLDLDSFVATNAFDCYSAGPQWYSNDYCPQAAPQDHETLFVKWQPYCFDHNSFLVGRVKSTQKQVEDLQDLIHTINSEWMQRMSESQPGLWLFCSTLSASSLFDRAVRTLKDLITGSPAIGFEDFFAIMHLAFAAAFDLTWQQNDYLFSALRDDALQWQHLLPSDEDKTRLMNAIDCWRLHQLEPPPLFTNDFHTNFGSSAPQESLYCGDQETLWDRLKDGEVSKVFIAFVDNFERARIQERNDLTSIKSRTRESQHMIEHITQPLQHKRGMEALRTVVVDTENQIGLGNLQNPREVEVTLITNGRLHSESREMFEKFRNLVTSRCNEAMLSLHFDCPPNWRDRYHVDDLDKVLEILEIGNGQQPNLFAVSQWPIAGGLKREGRDHPYLNKPLPSTPLTSNGSGSLEPSPNSAMSWTYSNSSHTAGASSHTTSPADTSQASASPTSPFPGTPSSVVKCPACSRPFSGTRENAMTNLRRHRKNSCRHNKEANLKCPMPECANLMRSDNLKGHLLGKHKMSDKSEIQKYIDMAKRLSGRGVDGNGRARRMSRRDSISDSVTLIDEMDNDVFMD